MTRMPRSANISSNSLIPDWLSATPARSRIIALPTKKSGEFLLHLSTSASQALSGADGASTNAMKERPRKRIDVWGRTAVALVTRNLGEPDLRGLPRLARVVVNERLTNCIY